MQQSSLGHVVVVTSRPQFEVSGTVLGYFVELAGHKPDQSALARGTPSQR